VPPHAHYASYPVLLADQALGSGSAVDQALGVLADELEKLGLSVIRARTTADAEFAITANAGLGAALLEWSSSSDGTLAKTIDQLHRLDQAIPVMLLAERSDVEQIPLEIAERSKGFFWISEDTPAFVAGRVARLVKEYVDGLLSPFFGALQRYVEDYNWSWSCPGHNGGMFYRKTPLGQAFFDYVGENFLRGDLCNASVELGSILQHEGPVLEAEKRAAEVFGAERTYFVLNGTSTSNKMVTLGLLTAGDLVLFDRNCHKSMHHGALMLAGAIPVFLNPTRDANGIIGPIDHRLLDEHLIREQIRAHPLVTDPERWRQERPFRLAILTNTTYDGVCYNAREFLEKVGPLCDYIVYDEAWMAYAKFHPLYRDRFGMDLTGLGPDDPGIYTTQSTHKCLAGFSQASQIHVRDSHLEGQPRHLQHDRFNEVFMMHTSTSPQYNMIASLDVGAQIMRGRQGVALMDDAIRESIALRKQIVRYHREIGAREADPERGWFFDVFGPRTVSVAVGQLEAAMADPRIGADAKQTLARAVSAGGIEAAAWGDVPDDILASVPECWTFHEDDEWHDFTGLAPDYVTLDPTKCSITTPGIRDGGEFDDWGIPAAIPAAILRTRGIVSEKTSFYTILVLVTAAIEKGKSATLLSELLEIKRLYDRAAPLTAALPALAAAHPERYSAMTLPELCAEMHEFLRRSRADLRQRGVYSRAQAPDIAITPAAAHAEFIAGRVELVPLDAVAGRIAATLIVVYPPGIAIHVPGERFARNSAAVAYLRLFEENDNLFPGFGTEMEGVFVRRDDAGLRRYHTYVVKE
jgi:ornithine decarboxylase